MSELRYTGDHEWVRIEGDIATCGISEYAQEQLGDIVFVDLPTGGQEVNQADEIAVVESVKAASDIFAPLSGEIIEVNEALADQPALVNSEPTDGGWFFKIKIADTGEMEDLMSEAAYKEFLAGLD